MKRILGFTVLSIITAMACAYHWRLQTMPYTLEISGVSSTGSMAQVFYDAGNGYREEDSVKKPVYKSTTLETLRFPLPARRINALRFDPLVGGGTLEIKKVTIKESGDVLHELDLETDFKAINDLSLKMSANETLIAHAPIGSTDPIIEIALSTPLDDWGVLDFLDEEWRSQAIFLSLMITPLILALALQSPSKTKDPTND